MGTFMGTSEAPDPVARVAPDVGDALPLAYCYHQSPVLQGSSPRRILVPLGRT